MLYILSALIGGLVATLGLCIFAYGEYKNLYEWYKAGREDERAIIERKLIEMTWKAREKTFDCDKIKIFVDEIEKLIKEEKDD